MSLVGARLPLGPKAWLEAYRRRDHHGAGIREGEWRILLTLAAEGRCSVKSAALASGASATSGLRYIADLERAGLIERVPHPHDRRSSVLSITPSGISFVEAML